MNRLVTFIALFLTIAGLSLAGCGSGGGVSSQTGSGNTPVGESGGSAQTATVNAPVAKQLTLTWDPVVGATSYNLYWSTAPGVTPATGNRISVTGNSYVHTGLTAGTTYYYVVTAVDSASESAASAPASKTTAL